MKKLILIALLASKVFAQDAENTYQPIQESDTRPLIVLASGNYYVERADINGYVVITPQGHSIGIPAADYTQPLTAEALQAALDNPPPPTQVVPSEVTRRQLKEWLILNDLFSAVEAELNSIPDAKQKLLALNWWTESLTFKRSHALVAQLAASLNLSPAQVDAAFIAASKL